jgi:hypothetical protein
VKDVATALIATTASISGVMAANLSAGCIAAQTVFLAIEVSRASSDSSSLHGTYP